MLRRHDGRPGAPQALDGADEAIAVLRARVADFAYGSLTDDLCMLAGRIH